MISGKMFEPSDGGCGKRGTRETRHNAGRENVGVGKTARSETGRWRSSDFGSGARTLGMELGLWKSGLGGLLGVS